MAPVGERLGELLGTEVEAGARGGRRRGLGDGVRPRAGRGPAAREQPLRGRARRRTTRRWPRLSPRWPTSTSTTPSARPTGHTRRPRASPTTCPATPVCCSSRRSCELTAVRDDPQRAAGRRPGRRQGDRQARRDRPLPRLRRGDPDRRRDVLQLLQGRGPGHRQLAGRGGGRRVRQDGCWRRPRAATRSWSCRRTCASAGSSTRTRRPALLNGVDVPEGWMGLDVGSNTIANFGKRIARAGTVFWNGPMGAFELRALRRRNASRRRGGRGGARSHGGRRRRFGGGAAEVRLGRLRRLALDRRRAPRSS